MECKYAVYLERVGAEVIECACVIGLPEVKVLLKPLQLKSVCLLLIGLCDYLSAYHDYTAI
jgi:hypothetical protein